MFKILVVTHGRLAEELLTAARTIAGDTPNTSALCLDWQDDLDSAHEKVASALANGSNSPDDGVLILTDIYGGTPFNVVRQFAEPGKVEVVCGVNLPMLVRLSCCLTQPESNDVRRAAEWIQKKGQSSICLCSEASSAGAGGDG